MTHSGFEIDWFGVLGVRNSLSVRKWWGIRGGKFPFEDRVEGKVILDLDEIRAKMNARRPFAAQIDSKRLKYF